MGLPHHWAQQLKSKESVARPKGNFQAFWEKMAQGLLTLPCLIHLILTHCRHCQEDTGESCLASLLLLLSWMTSGRAQIICILLIRVLASFSSLPNIILALAVPQLIQFLLLLLVMINSKLSSTHSCLFSPNSPQIKSFLKFLFLLCCVAGEVGFENSILSHLGSPLWWDQYQPIQYMMEVG